MRAPLVIVKQPLEVILHIDRPREFRTNDLFGPGPNYDLNACVGDNGGPYGYDDYGWGYIDAGHAIVKAAQSRDIPVDIAVYPITYCYRHGVELWLKHYATQLPELWDEKPNVRQTHRLTDNWLIVKGYLGREPSFDPGGDRVPFIDEVIKNLVEFDPNAEVFRFPEGRKGTPHLQDARIINVEVLGVVMKEVGETFKHFSYISDGMWEIKLSGP